MEAFFVTQIEILLARRNIATQTDEVMKKELEFHIPQRSARWVFLLEISIMRNFVNKQNKV